MIAVEQDFLFITQLLLSRADVDLNLSDQNGNTALHLACLCERTQHAKYLCEDDRVDVNALNHKHRTPLHLAAMNGFSSIIYLLFSNGNCDTNVKDCSVSLIFMEKHLFI